jgi:hypothetical protein
MNIPAGLLAIVLLWGSFAHAGESCSALFKPTLHQQAKDLSSRLYHSAPARQALGLTVSTTLAVVVIATVAELGGAELRLVVLSQITSLALYSLAAPLMEKITYGLRRLSFAFTPQMPVSTLDGQFMSSNAKLSYNEQKAREILNLRNSSLRLGLLSALGIQGLPPDRAARVLAGVVFEIASHFPDVRPDDEVSRQIVFTVFADIFASAPGFDWRSSVRHHLARIALNGDVDRYEVFIENWLPDVTQ